MGLLTNIKYGTKETGPKVGCFAGFCHHHWATTSEHTHVYHSPLFDSGMKSRL